MEPVRTPPTSTREEEPMKDQGQKCANYADVGIEPAERAYRIRSREIIRDVIYGDLPTSTLAYLADALFLWVSGSDYDQSIDGLLKYLLHFTPDGKPLEVPHE
jgi:hypothetical protein